MCFNCYNIFSFLYTRRASERLVIVNQAFHDVLNKEEPKKLYDQMCRFREVSGRVWCVTCSLLVSCVSAVEIPFDSEAGEKRVGEC